jgi:multidrug efflux pump subunit AcrA (membrane-fusion protein)
VLSVILIFAAGLAFFFLRGSSNELDEPILTEATRGLFVAEVLDQGEIQSSDNIEFRCEVQSKYSTRGISVLDVVEEGRMVTEGELLCKLDSAELEAELEEQEIAVANALDAVTAAENVLKAAEESKREYIEGTFVSAELMIDNDILLAQEDKRKAEDYYRHSQRLAAKRYITDDQLQADKFAVERANNTLKMANSQRDVLVRITKNKMLIQFDTEIDSAKSRLNAVRESLAIDQRKLAEIQDQINKCSITVPEGVSGQVVYANIFSSRGNSEWVLEPGASVRERQVLIKLPNRDKMQVRAAVNESRITSIVSGMAVKINVDALGKTTLSGSVSKVNQYAEPEGWGGGGVKKYAVYIDIKNPPQTIRPGMNASVSIQIFRKEDALMAPIQTVYGVGKRNFALIKKGDKWETRELHIEANNEKFVLISSGIEPGEKLAMNPAGYRHLLDLPEDVQAQETAEKSRQAELEKEKENQKEDLEQPSDSRPPSGEGDGKKKGRDRSPQGDERKQSGPPKDRGQDTKNNPANEEKQTSK